MSQTPKLMKYTEITAFTGELMLKILYNTHMEISEDTELECWKKLGHVKDSKHFQDFMNRELSVNAVTKYLAQNKIKVIFDTHLANMQIYVDDLQAFEKGVNQVVSDLENPETGTELADKLIKSLHNMTLDEKLEYYKKQVKEEIKRKEE
ncbi:hypothetical protein SGODD07_01290 [Streptococcus gordonii]|uniref:Uncharacterized protein n=1 Tax=Streptococcus gordonii TaxID=1302 RepID=A0A139N5L5_STRGN|nr:hypothetical protein SGODD07_01290 [Streptococcus gordonii]